MVTDGSWIFFVEGARMAFGFDDLWHFGVAWDQPFARVLVVRAASQRDHSRNSSALPNSISCLEQSGLDGFCEKFSQDALGGCRDSF